MKKALAALLILLTALSTSSCVNVIEKFFFKKDGSGTYTMTVEMGGLADMIRGFGGDEADLNEALSGASDEFEKLANRLEGIEGISNIRKELNSEDLTFSYLFDFSEVKSLNHALSAINHDEENDGKEIKYQEFFVKENKSIIRTELDPFKKSLNDLENEDMGGMDIESLFGDMYYDLVMEFEKNIKSVSNKDYQKDGKKSIRLKRYFFKKEDTKKSISVKIKTK